MTKNFIIDKAIYLLFNSKYYDLHNHYLLECIILNPLEKKIKLSWVKRNKSLISSENDIIIEMIFTGASYFQLSSNFISNSINTIQEIGYKDPQDFDLDWLNYEIHFHEKQHIFLRFEDDEFIRIYAENIEVVLI
jgi:hypothetical protein